MGDYNLPFLFINWYNSCYLYNINVYTMKKFFLIIALSIIALMATGQNKIDTTGMSDYEKYYYTKTGDIDTTVKAEIKNAETDDLYYISPKDGKQVITIFNRQKKVATPAEAQLYTAGYNDGYEEGVEDVTDYLYDDFSYSSRIYRFNYGFSFGYYSPYWGFSYGYYNPFWYDPWYYDPWYYPYSYWGYPYYGYGYPYYPYYPYNGYIYTDNHYTVNSGRGIMGSRYYTYQYHSPNKNINPNKYYDNIGTKSYNSGSRNISSSLSNDIRVNNTTRRTSPSTVSKSTIGNTQTRTISNTQNKSSVQSQTQIRTIEKSTYNQSNRTYAPSYNAPKMSTRPTYNNTQPHQMDRTSTQSRTYSTPNRSSYSTPNRSSSSSSYSAPSRSSSSYSSPKSSNSYSGGSSYSGGVSKSSGSSSNSHSSGGRR